MSDKHQKIEIKFQDGSVSIIDQRVYQLIAELQRKLQMLKQAEARQHKKDQYTVGFREVELNGSKYFVPNYATHRPAVNSFLRGNTYEPKTHLFVQKFFEQVQGSMVHAGTFFGDMLPSFSNSVNGIVYAFEPVLENFVLAKLCVEANQLNNVIIYNAALSDSVSNLRINTNDHGNHAGGMSSISEEGVICPTMKIDLIADDDLVLIQLDVEDHELIALQGATKTIERCRPVIAVEDNHKNCLRFLQKYGYELVGEIPGLYIWLPSEKEIFKTIVKQILDDLNS